MTAPTLHYIHDPLCGWCYGAAPLVRVARSMMTVQPHAGGMMTGAARRQISASWRQFVLPHDRRIAQVSGQPFGEAYTDGLLNDTTVMLDSGPPITAVLAAQALAGADAGLDMLSRIQQAHYVQGRRIADRDTLSALAAAVGLDSDAFNTRFDELEGAATQAHIAESLSLLSRVGGGGFPTFVLEQGGKLTVLEMGAYLGQPEAWQARLAQVPGAGPREQATTDITPPFCGIDGCTP